MGKIFTIGLVQTACSEDRAANLEVASLAVRDAAKRGAQIICLQELFNATYFCSREDIECFSIAEPINGPAVTRMQQLAKELDIAIVVPIFERRAPGIYHNSAAVIDAGGEVLGVYRKLHIPHDPLFYEKFYFTPGEAEAPQSGFKVFQTKYAKIGVLICWDQWFPEAARITSLMGAEVLFYPTAIGWHPAEKATQGEAQWSAWHTMQRAHAISNGVYVAAVNRVGHEPTPGTDGIEFYGRSFLSDPFGRIVEQAPTGEAATLVVQCDTSVIEETRQLWPFLRDRRIDSYAPITARYLEPGY